MGCLTMMRFLTLSAAVAAASALAAGQVQAATWLISYQSTGGSPHEATLDVTASDTLNAVGGYDVTAVSGNVDGDTVTGLIANPGQPFQSYSADGMFIYDNVIWPTRAPELSNPGLFFSGASGDEYNLFSDNSTTYELYKARPGVTFLANSVGTITLAQGPAHDVGDRGFGAAIPEPGAWALMILGFGGAGALLRRRRISAAAQAC
jgi:hypothetical protein